MATSTNETYENGQLVRTDPVEIDDAVVFVRDLEDEALSALPTLRTIATFGNTATSAQLTSAVKTLARAQIIIIRLLLRRLEAKN